MVEQGPTPEEIEVAQGRCRAFVASLSEPATEAEDKLPALVRSMNASSKVKLQKIYAIADELSHARAAFVACGKGCSSCCHMNVGLTQPEAERIGAAIGRKPVALASSVSHSLEQFAGLPCPFLDRQGSCSIYEHRPLTCRKHASFFMDATHCDPAVMNDVEVPRVEFSGLDEALFAVVGRDGYALVADIRDFFPVGPVAGRDTVFDK